MSFTLFKISSSDKTKAVKELISHSTPNDEFFAMIILSVILATLGLLMNSVAIIIASMLIAPLLFSILSLGMGFAMSDNILIKRSAETSIRAIIYGLAASIVTTWLFFPFFKELAPGILMRTEPLFPNIILAIIAGLAASIAMAKPKLNETLPGVAIAIALVPPLSIIGIGIAELNSEIILGALLLFLINIIGIILASFLVFSLMDFYGKRKIAEKIVNEEDEE